MGNDCSSAEKKEKERVETNKKLQIEREAAQRRHPVSVLLVGEENSGKDTICLQLLKKAKADSKKDSNDTTLSNSNIDPENAAESSPLGEVTPSQKPELYQLAVKNPRSIFQAMSGDDVHDGNLNFNLVTLPGAEAQREQFWNEKTFRSVAGANLNLKDDEALYADALIFVIDASQKERVERASKVLHEILHQKHLEKCPIVVFANKQDLPNAMKPKEVESHMKLIRVPGGRLWCVLGSSALKGGDELYSGLDWLLDNSGRFKQ